MTMKRTKKSQLKSMMRYLKYELETVINKDFYKEMPNNIRMQLQNIIAQTEKVTLENGKVKMLEGDMLTKEQILQIIIKATGYKKWKLDSVKKLSKAEIKDLKEEYAIGFQEKTINSYIFICEIHNKNLLQNMLKSVIVTVLPSIVQIDLVTKTICYQLDGLYTTKEMAKALKAEYAAIIK